MAAVSGALASGASRPSAAVQTAESREEETEAWALLSDTHIAADPQFNARGINMADHLAQAVEEVLKTHASRPFAGLMINGDCAYLDGRPEDYKTLATLIKPLSEGGIPIHLTLGNHDERTHIQAGLASVFEAPAPKHAGTASRERPVLGGKLASRVSGRFCDWYLLDSLEATNQTPGLLGEEQMAWLDTSLKARPERPALVMVHHNPQPAGLGKMTGLRDTDALLSLLKPRKQVKALFFGHTHIAAVLEVEGMHLVNLPACAYRFNQAQPTGWTSARMGPSGCVLTLFDTAKAHPLHAREIHLKWREA